MPDARRLGMPQWASFSFTSAATSETGARVPLFRSSGYAVWTSSKMKKDPFGMKVPETSAPGDIPANSTTAGAVCGATIKVRLRVNLDETPRWACDGRRA